MLCVTLSISSDAQLYIPDMLSGCRMGSGRGKYAEYEYEVLQ